MREAPRMHQVLVESNERATDADVETAECDGLEHNEGCAWAVCIAGRHGWIEIERKNSNCSEHLTIGIQPKALAMAMQNAKI